MILYHDENYVINFYALASDHGEKYYMYFHHGHDGGREHVAIQVVIDGYYI